MYMYLLLWSFFGETPEEKEQGTIDFRPPEVDSGSASSGTLEEKGYR